jgi:hypothetical protein
VLSRAFERWADENSKEFAFAEQDVEVIFTMAFQSPQQEHAPATFDRDVVIPARRVGDR